MIIDPFRVFPDKNFIVLKNLVEKQRGEKDHRDKEYAIFSEYCDLTEDYHHDYHWWEDTKRNIEKRLENHAYHLFKKDYDYPLEDIMVLEDKNINWALFVNHINYPYIFILYIKENNKISLKLIEKIITGTPLLYEEFTKKNPVIPDQWTFIENSRIKYPRHKDYLQENRLRKEQSEAMMVWIKSNCRKYSYATFKEGILFERPEDATAFIMTWC